MLLHKSSDFELYDNSFYIIYSLNKKTMNTTNWYSLNTSGNQVLSTMHILFDNGSNDSFDSTLGPGRTSLSMGGYPTSFPDDSNISQSTLSMPFQKCITPNFEQSGLIVVPPADMSIPSSGTPACPDANNYYIVPKPSTNKQVAETWIMFNSTDQSQVLNLSTSQGSTGDSSIIPGQYWRVPATDLTPITVTYSAAGKTGSLTINPNDMNLIVIDYNNSILSQSILPLIGYDQTSTKDLATSTLTSLGLVIIVLVIALIIFAILAALKK